MTDYRPYAPPPSPSGMIVHKWNTKPVSSSDRPGRFPTDSLDGWVFAAGVVLGSFAGFMLALVLVMR